MNDSTHTPKPVPLGNGTFAEVSAWSGNVHPFQARVYDDAGNYLGRTGFCKTRERAIRAAHKVAAVKTGAPLAASADEVKLIRDTALLTAFACVEDQIAALRVLISNALIGREVTWPSVGSMGHARDLLVSAAFALGAITEEDAKMKYGVTL